MKTECPVCKSHYKVDDEFCGKTIECPNCKSGVPVPPKEEKEQKPHKNTLTEISNDFGCVHPPGYVFYESWLYAAGIEHRMDDFMAAFSKRTIWFELQREPTNPYDSNAIKIIANGRHIAYVDRTTAYGISIDGSFDGMILFPRHLNQKDGKVKFIYALLKPQSNFNEKWRIRNMTGNIQVNFIREDAGGCLTFVMAIAFIFWTLL